MWRTLKYARSPLLARLAGSQGRRGAIDLARDSWKPYAAALFSQLQRASLSVQLNIAEGYAFGESLTYTRHLRIAYGSAVETGELLEIALKANVVPVDIGTQLLLAIAGVRDSSWACYIAKRLPRTA